MDRLRRDLVRDLIAEVRAVDARLKANINQITAVLKGIRSPLPQSWPGFVAS